MPPYRLAHLTPDQMLSLENLENEIGVTLVAYEPAGDAMRDSATGSLANADNESLVLDALNDTYRTYDPQI